MQIISPELFLIVEHGTKIVDREGNIVRADYFQPNEIEHILDFIKANVSMIKLLWFMTPDPKKKIQIWCKSADDIDSEITKRGHYAEVFHCSYEELRERLHAQPLSSISTKLQDFIKVENLKLHFTRSEIDILFQDGMMEFVRNITDKSQAILFLQQLYSIPTKNMLVAGNAINDVAMLNLLAGTRILVGSDDTAAAILGHLNNSDEVVRIGSPHELGTYLQELVVS